MSLILVVEQESRSAETIRAALSAEGWVVEVVPDAASARGFVAERKPNLVLIDSAVEESPELIRSYASASGGPGVLALVSAGQSFSGADATLDKPYTDERLRHAVRKCTSAIHQAAATAAAKEAASAGNQLTSADIFGDMLAEVEGLAAGRPSKTVKAVGDAPRPKRPRAKGPDLGDLDKKLEQTLSGVLSASRVKARPKSASRTSSPAVPTVPTAPTTPASGERKRDEDLDALLDQTLSGLIRDPKQPTPPVVPEPEIEAVPEPEIEAVPEPVLEAVPEPVVEAVPESVVEAGPEPAVETPSEPVVEMVPEPMAYDPPVAEVLPEPAPAEAEEPVAAGLASGSAPAPQPTDQLVEPEVSIEPPPELPDEIEDLSGGPADVYSTVRMKAIKLPPEPEPPAPPGPSAAAAPPSAPPAPTRAATPTPAPPKTEYRQFGQYTLLERVAVGGMAEVWKARMKGMEGFQKNVAIKRILPQLTDSPDFLTMFIDEAKLAAQLNHPHIIHIYDLGKIDDDYYIAMEYVAGKDLRSILNRGKKEGHALSLPLAVLIAARLASGLDYAHRKRDFDNRDLGLVHRDVSPQNVLISYEGDIKLCDFGIAKAVAKASKTQMGALKGKLQYMSPEQAWGRVVDARSDIFSLGAVFFEMLTGERLFSGDSEISVLESVRDGRIRSPRDVVPEVSPAVESIVRKALAKDPDDRYQTAGEMQQALEAVLYGMKPTPGQGALAAHMRELFAAEAQLVEASTPSSTPEAEVPAAGAEVPAVAPTADARGDEERRGMGLWIGIAAAVAILAGVAWFFASAGPADAPAADTTVAATLPATTAPALPLSPDPLEPTEGADPDGAEPPAGETAAPPAADEAGSPVDVEGLVDAQLRQREEDLRRQMEAQKQELERKLEEASATPEPEPTPTIPDPLPTPPPAPTTSPEPQTEAESAEPPASDPAAKPPEETEPPSPEPVTPTPRPAATPPPPQPAPEPAGPEYERGQIVESGTPGLSAPRLVSIDKPQYPAMARRLQIQGTVVLSVLVDENGNVSDLRVVQGVRQNVGINEAAESAGRSAKFQPATIEGVKVKTWFTLNIPFRL